LYRKLIYVIINKFIISYFKPFHFKLFKLVTLNDSIKSYFTSCFFFQSSLMSNYANVERNSNNTGQNLKIHQFQYFFKLYHVFFSLLTLHLVFQTIHPMFSMKTRFWIGLGLFDTLQITLISYSKFSSIFVSQI